MQARLDCNNVLIPLVILKVYDDHEGFVLGKESLEAVPKEHVVEILQWSAHCCCGKRLRLVK